MRKSNVKYCLLDTPSKALMNRANPPRDQSALQQAALLRLHRLPKYWGNVKVDVLGVWESGR